jgi:hypothetical protein
VLSSELWLMSHRLTDGMDTWTVRKRNHPVLDLLTDAGLSAIEILHLASPSLGT